ncbi:MAG TPA: NAD(P)-dependent oxidoreductase [Dehalococcoidales bacterium]|nr:NAD(P)-dependent oxidoreductase [Dehalococcoidales bacterium]
MSGVSGRHSYRMTLAESETRFCRCPPDTIISPFLARKGKAAHLGRTGVGRKGFSAPCYDPYLTEDAIQAMGATKVDFEQLLRESDYISIHCPVTGETKQMFGTGEFSKMKSTAYLINTARGDSVDEKTLFNALSEGVIAGAGIDVTDPEPPDPDDPLLQLENVIITAHSAFYSEDSLLALVMGTVGAVVDALKGDWPRFAGKS